MSELKKAVEFPDDKYAARRKAVVDAALECFLQYGFAKTSMEDIAKRAKLSRPLLYLLFKNKEEVFVESLREIYVAEIAGARAALGPRLSKREQLMQIHEELHLKPWTRIYKSPGREEFIEQCRRFFPQLDKEWEKEALKLMLPILGDRETAEVFMLSVDGQYADVPSPATLRKRIRLLIEQFV